MWEQLIAMVIQKSSVGCPELIDNDYDNLEMATRKINSANYKWCQRY